MPDLPLRRHSNNCRALYTAVLPILLGASIGRRAGARPAFIAAGFVAPFAFVALALNAVATALHFDPDALRTAGLVLLVIFGALMIWPAAFDRLTARLAGAGAALHANTSAQTNLGGFVLGTTLRLIWTPCAGPTGISKWFNSAPLSISDLRGKVVLVDFWTYGCYNCVNTLPYVTKL